LIAFRPCVAARTVFARIALLAALFAASWLGFAQNFNFTVYRARDGLPQNQIKAVMQDHLGRLWIGTYSGLARYNGREWRVYTKNQGLSRNEVLALGQDREGRILIGSRGGGLDIFDGREFTSFSEGAVLSGGEVTDILTDADGGVWVSAREGLALIRNGETREFTTADGLPSLECLDLHQRRNGSIWVATAGGVALFDGTRFVKPETLRQGPTLGPVRVMVEDSGGKLYLGADNGLFALDQGALRRIDDPLFDGAELKDAARDRAGRIWFATRARGALRYDGRAATAFTTANGLANNHIYCVAVDREGNIWFGGDDGLSRLTEGPFVVYNTSHGLVNDIVRAIHQDREGVIWFGTRDGASAMKDGRFVNLVDNARLESRVIYAVDQHPDGRVLFATLAGLTAFDKGSGVHQNYGLDRVLIDDLRALLTDRRGRVWLGGAGLGLWTERGFERVDLPAALAGIRILDMVEGRESRLWLATRNHGLVRFEPETRAVKAFTEGLDETLWTLALDQRGELWIGANGLGLIRYDGKRFTRYTAENGLANEFVWQVLCASNGDVWVGHNMGVDRLSQGEFVNYTVSDGLADNESVATACLEDRQGNLWFSSKGVTKYRADAPKTPAVIPLAHIERVEVTGPGERTTTAREGERLPRFHNSLRFLYAGVYFRNEADLRFRYKLEGLDEDWRAPTTDAFAPYNNLPRGEYRFLVKAGVGGVYGEPAEFRFAIAPAYWETWWFRGLAVVVLLILVGGYHRGRIQRMKRRNLVLENMVMERTQELADKNEELRQLSLSDSLTKLRNRRFLTEMMPVEIETLRRMNYQDDREFERRYALGFMMVDLDHFKKVNDTYGHDAGDKVLCQTAAAFKDVVRGSDIVVRWGGEEFLILLKEMKPGLMGLMAQRMLRALRDQVFDIGGGKTLRCTGSIGFAYYPGHREAGRIHWEDAVKIADLALYLAKRRGRDRAVGLGFHPNLSGAEAVDALRGDLDKAVERGQLIEVDPVEE